jgi:hypothetical protein
VATAPSAAQYQFGPTPNNKENKEAREAGRMAKQTALIGAEIGIFADDVAGIGP